MDTNEPKVTWQFEAFSADEETQYLELVKKVADTIENGVSYGKTLERIKQYAIMYFNDILTDY